MRPVDEIRKRLEARKEGRGLASNLSRFLITKGVCRSLAEEIAEEFTAGHLEETPALQQCLIDRLQIAQPLRPPFSLLLIGPTGIGKTTTLLKLASLYTKQDLRVAIVDLDRNPKLEQIATSWNISYLNEYKYSTDFDVWLIDTPGCNYYEKDRVEQLGELISAIPVTERLLTLSAATKDVDVYGAIHQFSCLEPDALIFTKLDETLAGGILLNVCQKTTYPLRYIAYGFPLPGKIELADPKVIATKILSEMNCEEFSVLRQLIIE